MKERHKILLISAFILFSFSYIYDIPAALNKYLHLQDDPYNAQKLTLLYSVYAFPNMILPLVFTFQNIVSERTRMLLLCLCVFVGHTLFTIGAFFNSFILMLLGRFIYGIGGECFGVIQNKIISHAFCGKELALSMSVSSAIARTGTVLNYLLTPLIAVWLGKIASCSIGIFLTFCGFLACLVLVKYNDKLEKRLEGLKETIILEGNTKRLIDLVGKMNLTNNEMENHLENSKTTAWNSKGVVFYNEDVKTNQESEKAVIDSKPFIKSENMALMDGWAVSENISNSENSKDQMFTNQITKTIVSSNPKTFSNENDILIFEPELKGSLAFSPGFSLLVAISFMIAVVWAPYSNIASLLFQKRYQISNIFAGRLLALQESLSIIFSICVGCISDFIGFKLFFVAFGCILMITSHFFIYYTYGSVFLPVIILGFAGPFIACYWPCITYLVSVESLSIGFSIFTCALNVAYTFSPIMVGIIVSRDKTYDTVEFFEIFVGIVVAVFISYLCLINKNMNLNLNRKSFTN